MYLVARYWYFIVIIILLGLLFSGKEETKTIIKKIPVKEVVKETIIDTNYKTVYVTKTKTVKGKDSIVYIDKPILKPFKDTLQARQYNTLLKTDNATASLKITTTSELLDVTGEINYEKEVIKETKYKNASGFFIYGKTNPVNLEQIELGLAYQIKNKFMLLGGASYNQFTNGIDFKVGVGLKL